MQELIVESLSFVQCTIKIREKNKRLGQDLLSASHCVLLGFVLGRK